MTLRDYALDWIERYQGTGRRGFREETRDAYRAQLESMRSRTSRWPSSWSTSTPSTSPISSAGWSGSRTVGRHALGRDLPIPLELADKLRRHVAGRDPDALVFESALRAVRPGAPVHPGALPGLRRGGRRVRRLTHLPAHGREPHVRRRPKRRAGAALARSPLGRVQAKDVRAPARAR